MDTKLLLFFVVGLICGISTVHGAEEETAKEPSQLTKDPQATPLEQGMAPVFTVTKLFLNNVLQPDDRGPPEVFIQSLARLVDNDLTTSEMMLQLENNWQSLSKYYLGFAICLVIGLLFIVIMPIVGFCFCCCRLCGNCGGKASQMDPKHAGCKRACYTVSLLIIATVMLACIVCSFVAIQMLHTQMTDKERGVISKVNRSVVGVEDFVDSTVNEVKTDVPKSINAGIDAVSVVVNHTGSELFYQVGEVTGLNMLFSELTSLATDLVKLKSEINVVSSVITSEKDKANTLSNELTAAKDKIINGLQSCSSGECNKVKDLVNTELKLNPDFAQIPNLGDVVDAIDQYSPSLETETNDAKANFDKYGTDLTAQIRTEIDNALLQLNDARTKVNNKIMEFGDQMANFSDKMQPAKDYLKQVPTNAQEYDYASYVGYGLSCLFLIIVLLMFLGMAFGVCGERAYDDARCCNKGVGANCLLASVGIMFLTSAILMLVTMIFYLIGAPLQTEVCRHLQTPIESPFIAKIDSYFNLGQYLYGPDSKEKLSIAEVLEKCKKNTAVYSALKLNQTFDVSTIVNDSLDELKPHVEKLVTELKNIPTEARPVFPQVFLDKLDQIANEDGFKVSFDQAIAEMKKSVTTDLSILVNDLQRLGVNSADVNNAIQTLDRMKSNDIPNMEKAIGNIMTSLMSLQRVNNYGQLALRFKENATSVNEKLSANTVSGTITEAADGYGAKMTTEIDVAAEEVIRIIENDVGRCHPLYASYDSLVTASCGNVLLPFNSFWCAFGLCLLLFIPAIIFAVKLATLYRKTDKHVGKPFEPLGPSVYPGGSIPLDNSRGPPPYRGGYDNSSAPPLQYGMMDYEMPYSVPSRKGLNRDDKPLLDQRV